MSSQQQPGVPRTQLFFAKLMRATPGLWRTLGNLETRTLGSELDPVTIRMPVYVSGLARSGTTVVTELLSRHPAVTSHRYSDFPPVWTPYWWNSLRARLPLPAAEPAERAHRDRLKVTPDSPEAVEEVIWMHFFEHAHDRGASQVLDAGTENAAFERFYSEHIRKLLLARGATRYLAKGNYNITRLQYLLKLFPDARFVILVRHPVWHIASLMKQDRLFREMHRADARATDYLKLLGHYEFGVHKEPVNVGDADLADEVLALWDTDQAVRGWALYWRSIYRFLHERLADDGALRRACLVLRYEDLCADPSGSLRCIVEHAHLEMASFESILDAFAGTISPPDYYQHGFSEKERDIIADVTRDVAERFEYDPQ